MKCEEAGSLIPALVLGDLDVEARRDLEAHLVACVPCRAESDRARAALGALESVPALETSEGRRERAAGAMSREHAALIQGFLLKKRRGWFFPASVAAALVAIVVAGFLLLPRRDLELRVTEVNGRAQFCRDGTWAPLQPETVLRAGDRVMTESETVVRFTVGGEGELWLNQRASLLLSAGRRLELDRGELCGRVELRRPITVVSVGNDQVVLQRGRFEIGQHETWALVGGAKTEKPKKPEGADVSFVDRPFAEAAAEVSRISGKTIRPEHDKVANRTVTFYGFESRGAELWRDFEEQMALQNIVFRPDGAGLAAKIVYPMEKRDVARHLFIRLLEGEAELSSARGGLSVRGGEEGYVEMDGAPKVMRLPSGEIAAWTRPDYYATVARTRLPLPGVLAFRVVGHDSQQRPILECTVEGSQVEATFEGQTAYITLGQATSTGEGEILVPLRIQFKK